MAMLFSPVQAQEGSAPDKPRGLEATATHDSVTLTWDNPGDDSITGYVVLRRIPGVDPQGHFNELVSNTGTDATTYTDDTVSAETRYTYRIKAINEHGVSERSRWSHIDVPAAPEAAEGDDPDGEGGKGDGGGAPGGPGKKANVAEPSDGDCAASVTTTCEVEVGGSVTGNIGISSDNDWFKIVLEAGKTYQIDLKGVDGGGGTLEDPFLENIRDSEADTIDDTANDDIGGEDDILDSRITFTPTEAGTYYLVVRTASSGTGTYTLSVGGDTPACTLNEGDIWCGVVDVGDITNNSVTQSHGFQGTTGGLSDKTFSLMFETGTTNNYTIVAIVVGATTANSEQLYFVTSSSLTDTDVESLTLHVDGESDPFVWSDSTEVITGSYRWPARTDLDWSSETTVTLRLREFPRPTVTNVAVTSTPMLETDTYGAGETIEVSVTFSEAVNATSDTDFVLSVGGARRAPLLSGSGTATLGFGYTVVSSDEDTNGIWIGDETRTLVGDRNGEAQNGEITSVATGAAAVIAHTLLGTDSDHKVDGSRTTDNVAPSFTSSATFDAAENQTAAGTVVAADSDSDDSVTGYAITGGADQALFEIGATSGELTFKSAPNYEDPQDSGTDNVHEVTVEATSGTGTRVMTADQTITVTVTDVDTEAPGKPGTPTVSAGSATSLRVNWSAPSNAGPPITGYDVRHRTSSPEGSWTEKNVPSIAAVIESLSENTSYDVQVRATNAEGTGAWSDSGNGTTDAAAVLPTLSVGNASGTEGGVVTFTVTLSAAAAADVTATWTASIGTGDTAVAGDLGTKTGTAFVAMGVTTGTFDVPTAEDSTEEENETFTVTLSGVSSNAQLAADPTAKGTILDDDDDNAAPSFSSSASRHVAENTTAVVTVTASDADTGDDVTGYEITGGADQDFFSIGATSGALTFDAAPNYEDAKDQGSNNTYVVDVTATSGTGTREMTATQTITVTVTDVSGEAPGKPAKPRVSAASVTSLRVNWSAPSNAGPAITDYDVQYRAGTSGAWSTKSHSGTATATTLTGLTEDTPYQVQVRAKNAEGTGAWSDSGSGTPAEEDDLPADTTTTGEVEVGGAAVRGDILAPVEETVTWTAINAEGVEVEHTQVVYTFDTDWFAVQLEEGRTYRIDMKGALLSTDTDLTLRLPQINAIYDADGDSLVNTWSRDESDSHYLFRVTFHAHADGTHYIAASGESFEWGSYKLRVKDITEDDD